MAEYRSLAFYMAIAFAIALFIRFFIAAPYIVSGASMEPTFDSLHYLIIDRLTYQFEEPQRGDVVVFKFPLDPSRSFIKRVIGLPGEQVVIEGTTVRIVNQEHPGGFALAEPYIAPENVRAATIAITLGEDEYFVMGDNRRASADSRVWGALPKENITGRALVRLFPLNLIGVLPGSYHYETN